MQVFIVFLVSAFLIGSIERLGFVRRHPILILTYSAVVAASFYLLRVVLR